MKSKSKFFMIILFIIVIGFILLFFRWCRPIRYAISMEEAQQQLDENTFIV